MSVEEEKKDYSGLKIGTLKIGDKEGAPESSSGFRIELKSGFWPCPEMQQIFGRICHKKRGFKSVTEHLNLTCELSEGRRARGGARDQRGGGAGAGQEERRRRVGAEEERPERITR